MKVERGQKVLGTGGYGTVFDGFWDSIPVAIKRLELVRVDSTEKEEEALRNMKHPNVIKMYHAESDSNFR